jgi:hypothetical protein
MQNIFVIFQSYQQITKESLFSFISCFLCARMMLYVHPIRNEKYVDEKNHLSTSRAALATAVTFFTNIYVAVGINL